jgi:hypothetical protein
MNEIVMEHEPIEPTNQENWKRFELLLANFQNIGKSQSWYVSALAGFLCLTWMLDVLHTSGGVTVQLLGASVHIEGLWPIVPLVSTVLCLALLGSINLIHHAWRRLDLHITKTFADPFFFFTELDPHKNVLDYFACLRVSLNDPVLPDTKLISADQQQKWDVTLFWYPSLLVFSIYTCSFTLHRVQVTWGTAITVVSCTLLQWVFALPILWRKTCLFFGVHKNAYDGVDWGTRAYYEMPLDSLKKIVIGQERQRQD